MVPHSGVCQTRRYDEADDDGRTSSHGRRVYDPDAAFRKFTYA